MGERPRIREQLVESTQHSGNWDQILPGTRDALERIARKFRIAVISNADGGIERVLSRCGIADCFESITDSGIVGIEKPRPEIFEAALTQMKARADERLSGGAVDSVGYVGAPNAAMQAVVVDVS